MVAHDYQAGKSTSPVSFETKTVDGVKRPVPTEPHIGSTTTVNEREATVQTGYARGGTTRPPKGQSGEVEQLDNDGNPVAIHPGEIARIVEEEGSQAANKKLTGDVPPGDPEPTSKKKKG